jgi:threonine dehydrogenase-like Zn-dependent dehydrogenase
MAVLVIGGGTIGLLTAFVAARARADVTIVARHSHQRIAAGSLGVPHVVDVIADEGVVTSVAARPPDVVFETVGGLATTLPLALACVRPGGAIVTLGVFSRPVTLDAQAMLAKEARLVPSMMYRRSGGKPDFVTALATLRDERPRLAPLVTHRVPLREIDRAFALASAKRSGAIKVAVEPNQKL